MKFALLIALAISSLTLTVPSTNAEVGFNIASTVSEQAATVSGYNAEQLDDHYGNPDQFIQYIIRVPPIHA